MHMICLRIVAGICFSKIVAADFGAALVAESIEPVAEIGHMQDF